MKSFNRVTLFAAFLAAVINFASAASPSRQQIEQNTRLQVFLDNANFGPGKIDGRDGEFTKKAMALFKLAKGEQEVVTEAVFASYTVTEADFGNVGELPSGPVEQAKVKRLPYATVAEALAEKFHCDLDFLKELNPKQEGQFKVGDRLTVPNVKPFELSDIKTLQPGSEASALVANELGDDTPSQTIIRADDQKAQEEATIPLHISVKDEMLEVRAKGKVVAAFPVTVGSEQISSPVGRWTIKAIAKMPNFRYDPKMLKEGERSSDFHMLPPGPNNPVGVVWIALNKKGIGIHGTNEPDSIGRSVSHGCIRLANWDVVKLAELVKPGVPVVIE